MILHFAPLGSSCWYSKPVKDGALVERGFQALCTEVSFLAFLLQFCSRSLSTLATEEFLISFLKQISSEDLVSKS
jgi:hypothetical protein